MKETTLTVSEALSAIKARIDGEWDNPALVKFGPLSTSVNDDILSIMECVPIYNDPMDLAL